MLHRARQLLAVMMVAGLLPAVAHAAPAPAYSFPVAVSDQPVTRPLPGSFLGLALEYGTVTQWTAHAGETPDALFPALLHGLDPTAHPVLRIGGQSGDRSWWPVPGVKQPLGVTQDLGPTWTVAARTLIAQTGARLLLGINFDAGSMRVAQVEADELVAGVGAQNILALELGNEPDLYRDIPWYWLVGGQPAPWYSKSGLEVFSRADTWDPDTFVAQYRNFEPSLPKLSLAGPDTNASSWLLAFDDLLGRGSSVRMLTTHAYGLNQCVTDPGAPLYPSVTNLLTMFASRGMFSGIGPSAALAHRDGDSYRVDEMGSVTCNGRLGVSNTFASALWAMDALFQAARMGLNGVNLHTFPGSANGLFDLYYSSATHQWSAVIHPLYDGAYMFAQADPIGAQLLRVGTGSQTYLRAWATRDSTGHLRVLLINDNQTRSASVRLSLPSAYAPTAGTIERLQAPSASATTGITIGGEPFASTVTGVPPAPLTTPLPAGATRTVVVPAASAALVTIPPA